ncbi:hypothetical protein BH10PSE6_BH10PSE6_16360 [soil metagenome]
MSTELAGILARHRAYFLSGKTRPPEWREQQLAAVAVMVTERADEFYKALWSDLRRNRVDAAVVDLHAIAEEAAYARRHVRRWMKPLHERTPWVLWPGRTVTRFNPLGVGLIIGAWNYPIQLTLAPLIAALSGGNAAVLKPSEVSPASADALARLVPQYLDRDAVSVVTGGVDETTALLDLQWDHIFFTGGPPIGKIVMAAAAKHLTPVVLELGGKSPAIVHASADLKVAARRIAHGRWLNAGQTCTAPDYVLVSREVAPDFLGHLKTTILDFYGADPQQSPDYGRIVSARHFDRLKALLASGTVFHGGQSDRDDLYVAPTVLTDVPPDAAVLQDEIFGPILPVLVIDSVEQAISMLTPGPIRWASMCSGAIGRWPTVFSPRRHRATPPSTTARSSRSCASCRSAASATPAWASITGNGGFAPTPMPVACSIAARASTLHCATRLTAETPDSGTG